MAVFGSIWAAMRGDPKVRWANITACIGSLVAVIAAFFITIASSKDTEKLLNITTGGDSYPYVIWSFPAEEPEHVLLQLKAKGNYPIYDLVVRVTDSSQLGHGAVHNDSDLGRAWEKSTRSFRFPTPISERLANFEQFSLGSYQQTYAERQEFSIVFYCRNGMGIQSIQLAKNEDKWEHKNDLIFSVNNRPNPLEVHDESPKFPKEIVRTVIPPK